MRRHHQRTWVGIDAGKAHHWAVGLDADGYRVFSRKVVNDEQEIAGLIEMACGLAVEGLWDSLRK